MSISEISPSSTFPIIIFLDATRNHKERELKLMIHNLRLRPDVFRDGDTIIIIGVLHKIQHPMGHQMQASVVSSSGTNIRVIKDEVLRKADAYVKMLDKSVDDAEEESREVDITVKVCAGIPPKLVVFQESIDYNAAWVILDRFLKKDYQFYLKQLSSNVAIVMDDLSVQVLRQTSATTTRIDNNIVKHVTIFSVSKPVPSKTTPDSNNIEHQLEFHDVENNNSLLAEKKDGLLISNEDNNHKSGDSLISEIFTDDVAPPGGSEILEVNVKDDVSFVPTRCSRGEIVVTECDELNSSEDKENGEFLSCIRSPVASSSSGSRNSEVEEIVVSAPDDHVSKEYKDLDKDGLCCVLKEVKSDFQIAQNEVEVEAKAMSGSMIKIKDSEELEMEMEIPRLASSLLTLNLPNGGFLYRNQFMSLIEVEIPISIPIFTHDPSRSLCGICFEEKNNWQILNVAKCDHTFCYDCMSKYIVTKIEGNTTTISCPGINCKSFLDINSFRKIVPNDILLKWDELLCMSLIPQSQMVYCPFQDCSALFIKDSEELVVRDIKCLNCRRLFCGECLVPWHTEFSCEEFRKVYAKKKGKEVNLLLVKELAKKKQWRQCPNCKFYVEKTEGCLHIACRCGYGFCYGCGGRWNGGCKCKKSFWRPHWTG